MKGFTKMGRVERKITGFKLNKQKSFSSFQTIGNISKYVNFPVTVQLQSRGSKFYEVEGFKGMFTLQYKEQLTRLKCIASDGREVYITANSPEPVLFLSVDNTNIFNSVEELRANKKENNIIWFVSTKDFSVNHTLFYRGQIFTFAASTILNRSFRRERQRGIYVEQYPSMKRCFLPMTATGGFKKCDPPSVCQEFSINEIAKSDNLPYFIIQDTKKSFMHDSAELCNERLFVVEKETTEFIFASKKEDGCLKMYVFSSSLPLEGKVVHDSKPVDTLDHTELKTITKSFNFPSDKDTHKHYFQVYTYKELGISRLLEEIFIELNQKLKSINTHAPSLISPVDSQNKSESHSCMSSDFTYETIPQTVQHLPNHIGKHKTKLPQTETSSSYLSSIDNLSKDADNVLVSQNTRHVYINECSLSDMMPSKNDTERKLVVQFDDGGYVVIPFTGDSPRITLDRKNVTYKSTDNTCYGYNYVKPNPISSEDPVYSYISMEALDFELKRLDCKQHLMKPKEEVRYSFSYDYPHIGHFRIPRDLSKLHVGNLSVEEVSDILKLNLMKTHVDLFQKNVIDGEKLSKLTEPELTKMGLTKFESRKLRCFIDGWRPLKDGSHDDLWLGKMPCDWSVFDLSRYLLHINMRSLQRFTTRNDVDGFLLKKILKDDVLESLKDEHGVAFRDKELDRLRKYVDEDDKPKFKYVR